MPPYVEEIEAGAAPSVAVRLGEQDWTPNAGSGLQVVTTLSGSALAGDLLWFYLGTDDASTTYTNDRSGGLTLVDTLGSFRQTSFLWYTTLTSGDISTGSVTVTFTWVDDDGFDEAFVVTTFETTGLNPTPVQLSLNESSSDVTSVAGETLTGVTAGSVVLALALATPDGGTNGLTLSSANGFTQLGSIAPSPYVVGGVQIDVQYFVSTSGGSVTGPSYANDATGGNITNVGVWELGATP